MGSFGHYWRSARHLDSHAQRTHVLDKATGSQVCDEGGCIPPFGDQYRKCALATAAPFPKRSLVSVRPQRQHLRRQQEENMNSIFPKPMCLTGQRGAAIDTRSLFLP